MAMFDELPQVPDDDADFTPQLAREIMAKYRKIIGRQEVALAECHKEIFRLRDELLTHASGQA